MLELLSSYDSYRPHGEMQLTWVTFIIKYL
ncbi:Uncharacterised protein [Yersinia aldovae]|uniref:Uncharacterized protein n=1 Tax=Yersinia aldovae TaxID=29483 RepID=A0A0T9URD5_YERAL|nr:Uncharacterised protein [Yersinia aldovae]CNL43823.1 Uncharacterised protein [Yersinia aldovae]CNL60917.1 Uncharacterised protein [Yersinia aldovae]